MKNELKDHIDDPIKKTVVGLSLLGFKTHMSCCGFEYKGSQVKKSHLTGKAYVYLDAEQVFASPELKERLCDLSLRSKWKFEALSGGKYIDFYGEKWPETHPWVSKDAVHSYENAVLNIWTLNKAIEVWEDYFKDYAYIRDGNHKYKELTTYWQYEPAEPWYVTPKTWAELPY
jgi:hypothetical protein